MEIKRYDTTERFSRAVVHQGVIYFTGHISARKEPTMKEQMKSLTKRLDGLLEEFGSDKNHVLYAKINIHDWSMFDEMNEVWDTWFDSGCTPARTCVQTTLTSGYLVEITLTAAVID